MTAEMVPMKIHPTVGKPIKRHQSASNYNQLKKIFSWNQTFREGEFRCSSGQCIDQDNKCDGKAECDDHSDEIRATCWNVKCPGFTHRCKYGACVKRLAECNGVVECFDGSDEDPAICKNSTVAPPVTPAPVPPRPSPGVKYERSLLRHCVHSFVLGVAAFCHSIQNLENGRLCQQTLLDILPECQ